MYPATGVSPVDLNAFPALEGVLDVVYNPARTQLLLDAEARGLVAHNGLWMLVAQAKESAEWFTGSKIADDMIESIYCTLRRQMENIILIGMPGCGKSTIGRLLAEKTKRIFKDADQVIEETAGKTIPDIFAEDGEQAFRDIESSVLRDLGKESGLVIATGGGCVTRSCNYPSLHQNGTIYWLERDIASLPTDGRPLSHKDTLRQMYQIRQPLYAAFADHTIENHDSIENTVMRILNQEGYV
jgi:shikimate dehydrogenase